MSAKQLKPFSCVIVLGGLVKRVAKLLILSLAWSLSFNELYLQYHRVFMLLKNMMTKYSNKQDPLIRMIN